MQAGTFRIGKRAYQLCHMLFDNTLDVWTHFLTPYPHSTDMDRIEKLHAPTPVGLLIPRGNLSVKNISYRKYNVDKGSVSRLIKGYKGNR